MMGFYDSIAQRVSALLAKRGRTVVLRKRVVNPTYNPATGTTADGTVDTELYGLFLEEGKGSRHENFVSATGRTLYLQADGVVKPEMNDLIVVMNDGVEQQFVITSIEKVQPAETSVLYILSIEVRS